MHRSDEDAVKLAVAAMGLLQHWLRSVPATAGQQAEREQVLALLSLSPAEFCELDRMARRATAVAGDILNTPVLRSWAIEHLRREAFPDATAAESAVHNAAARGV